MNPSCDVVSVRHPSRATAVPGRKSGRLLVISRELRLSRGGGWGLFPVGVGLFPAVKFSPGPARNFAANNEDSYRRVDGSLMANRLADADVRVPPRKGANYSP